MTLDISTLALALVVLGNVVAALLGRKIWLTTGQSNEWRLVVVSNSWVNIAFFGTLLVANVGNYTIPTNIYLISALLLGLGISGAAQAVSMFLLYRVIRRENGAR